MYNSTVKIKTKETYTVKDVKKIECNQFGIRTKYCRFGSDTDGQTNREKFNYLITVTERSLLRPD